MADIPSIIAAELDLRTAQVTAALALFADGATVPFVARYRKERTGNLDEVQLRQIAERHQYLSELENRKQVILEAIEAQGKLTPDLKASILACEQKTELEDLYLPYRPKRRTRATAAREKGLEPLADQIEALNQTGRRANLLQEAEAYIDPEQGVETAEDALQGAADILAERVAEQADLRSYIRDQLLENGRLYRRH
jgi:uncharacterized protein